jgi:hypothetical protein
MYSVGVVGALGAQVRVVTYLGKGVAQNSEYMQWFRLPVMQGVSIIGY